MTTNRISCCKNNPLACITNTFKSVGTGLQNIAVGTYNLGVKNLREPTECTRIAREITQLKGDQANGYAPEVAAKKTELGNQRQGLVDKKTNLEDALTNIIGSGFGDNSSAIHLAWTEQDSAQRTYDSNLATYGKCTLVDENQGEYNRLRTAFDGIENRRQSLIADIDTTSQAIQVIDQKLGLPAHDGNSVETEMTNSLNVRLGRLHERLIELNRNGGTQFTSFSKNAAIVVAGAVVLHGLQYGFTSIKNKFA